MATSAARDTAAAAVTVAADLTGFQLALSLGALAEALLAAGENAEAAATCDAAWQACPLVELLAINAYPLARVALVRGAHDAARRWADDAVAASSGAHRMTFLAVRVRVAIAQGDTGQAVRDAQDALAIACSCRAYLTIPGVLESLAELAADNGSRCEAARLFGSAQAMRDRTGEVRFIDYAADYVTAVEGLRAALGDADFDAAWAEGAALSTDAAIGYARRGHGEHSRTASGWAALTPTELDVVRLVSEGLSNKEVAQRLFVSPRTVQTHLTHVYAKLGLSSRTQLVGEAASRR